MVLGGFDLDGVQRAAVFIGAIGAAAGVISNVAWRVFRWGKRVTESIEAAHRELVPNGGSSLRDAITRIETLGTQADASRAKTVATIDVMRETQGEIQKTVQGLEVRLDGHLHEHAQEAEIDRLAREQRSNRRKDDA